MAPPNFGAGLVQLGWISENNFGLQIAIIVVVMGLAIFFRYFWRRKRRQNTERTQF